jgi:hypothetical protein
VGSPGHPLDAPGLCVLSFLPFIGGFRVLVWLAREFHLYRVKVTR